MSSNDRIARQAAMAEHDRAYWANCARVAGMDEAGRGPLAGNVVAACVIMPPDPVIDWVDDSKKLSAKRREIVFEQIMKTALFVGVGRADAREIDEINILQATMNAMRRAAAGADANIYLIDAVKNLGLDAPEIPIIHGDAVSYSIAAASIVAKVTRDRELEELDRLYPQYGFARHKGYGTAAHIAAIRQYGPCPEHRMTFIGKFV
ncbi:MAG: ribonuclease HII [Clostridia bacterium]|nr:ribonuclease HII [Clostridia bacterium]